MNVARIARKRKARKSEETRNSASAYNSNPLQLHSHVLFQFFVRFVLFLANPSVIFIIIIIITLYSEFFASYIMFVMFSLTVLSKHASVGCVGG